MSLTHLILGLLDDMPMSGYDLNKAFAQGVQHFWTVDQSQIYRTLYKLDEQGKVRVELVKQTDNPDKKVYHITDDGREMLDAWLRAPIPQTPAREGWLGQLHFGDSMTNEDIIALMQAYRDEVNISYQTLYQLKEQILGRIGTKKIPRKYRLRLITLDYGIDVMAFHLQWFDQHMDIIQQLED